MITTRPLAVAFRLSTELPSRIHRRPYPEEEPPGTRPDRIEAARRREQIRAWHAEGVKPAEMARRLQVTREAVYAHLKIIRAESPSTTKGAS